MRGWTKGDCQEYDYEPARTIAPLNGQELPTTMQSRQKPWLHWWTTESDLCCQVESQNHMGRHIYMNKVSGATNLKHHS